MREMIHENTRKKHTRVCFDINKSSERVNLIILPSTFFPTLIVHSHRKCPRQDERASRTLGIKFRF